MAQTLCTACAVAHPNTMSFEQPSTSLPPATTVLDELALARLRELDPGGANRLLERVIGAFLKSLDQHAPVLEAGRDDPADLNALRHVAHTLKSAAASLGALTLSQRCAEIEALARAGRTDGLGTQLDAVLAEMAGARLAMQKLLDQE